MKTNMEKLREGVEEQLAAALRRAEAAESARDEVEENYRISCDSLESSRAALEAAKMAQDTRKAPWC